MTRSIVCPIGAIRVIWDNEGKTEMATKMNWERVRYVGRRTLDHRGEFRRRDRANAWLMKCFQAQRAAAKSRGIPFAMTYDEWLGIWQGSGRLRQRGTASGSYVMGRKGDVGPYASSNVKIITIQENMREAAANRKLRQALTAASADWVTASSTAAVPW
jgi:hypothetical protein